MFRSPWPFRASWLVLPVTLGPLVDVALHGSDRPAQLVVSILGWVLWAAVVAIAFVPRSVSLTIVRLSAPAPLPLAAWASVRADDAPLAVVGLLGAAVALGAALLPGLADVMVDGSSYGRERRVALRPPTSLSTVAVPLAWLLLAAGLAAGPILLAAQQWVAGVVATAAGGALAVPIVGRLHQLSRRWLVFVPGGVVVHDPVVLADPVLIPKTMVTHFGPAREGSTALDLTGPALGLALELGFDDDAPFVVRTGPGRGEHHESRAVLVTPTLPAVALAAARDVGLRVTAD